MGAWLLVAVGGFWGIVLANLLVALMYAGFVFSVAELSTALPHAGGFYSYVRYAFGPLAGFICGVMVTIQYVFLAAVSVGLIAEFLSTTFEQSASLCALLLFLILLAINIRSTRATFRLASLFGLLSITIVIIFALFVWYTDSFLIEFIFNLPPDTNQSRYMPKGWWGVFAALPFAMWFYLPLEQVSFVAEEVHHPAQEIPAALKRGFVTLFVLSFLTLLSINSSGGGALAASDALIPMRTTLTLSFEPYTLYFESMVMLPFLASALVFI